MKVTDGLFHRVFDEVAAEYEELERKSRRSISRVEKAAGQIERILEGLEDPVEMAYGLSFPEANRRTFAVDVPPLFAAQAAGYAPVADALHRARGVAHIDMPATPQRIFETVMAARPAAAAE